MQSYAMHKPANDPIFTFIEKKRSEGKCGKLAMVAGLNKFLRVYYGTVSYTHLDVYKRQDYCRKKEFKTIVRPF